MAKPKRVGLIGAGAIGTVLAEAIQRELIICDELVIYDTDLQRAQTLKNKLQFPIKIVANIDTLIAQKPKVIVEAASQQAITEYFDKLLTSNIDIIVMSTGALLNLGTGSPHIHFPSGAIGGLDALSSATLAGIDEITLTTHKPPKTLGQNNTQEELIIYEGYAKEAAQRFPKEMNVAATLALTVKPAKVKVQVISDPKIKRNTHKINIKWPYGEMQLQFANEPHPDNPHTSALAAWSAINLLKNLLET
ncbi:MAG: aspartate dehydrogenase [Candidatus Bathyarchaeota archaeon]|nr:aspartate dehydrogenase [Candidatus Termiticorpusculum sp.]